MFLFFVQMLFNSCQFKGFDQSNIVCEYEVNLSSNEKVITEKKNFNKIDVIFMLVHGK